MAARRTKARRKGRLDPGIRPRRIQLHVAVDPNRGSSFRGEVAIVLDLARATRTIRLHAVDLRLSRAQIDIGTHVASGEIETDAGFEMAAIRFDEPIPAGTATLRLRFAGKLRSDLSGLYGVRVGDRKYAFTQLEATDARRFFPCFDEPAMKARFEISVTTGAGNTAISNAPIARCDRLDGDRKTVHFEETPPLSSYLVALAIGELERSKPARVGSTEIRLWHTPGNGHLTAFGLEATAECLMRLEKYFALPYPYAKLDMLAVPDFEFGAMENAGAVFFRETLLLLDPDRATLAEKKRAAEVICHELAHMWYGDLVTMAWWDDLWLNEAFATWMAFRIVDEWMPEWRMWHDFQHGRAAALELDALRHTHPIYCNVETAEDANENFDLITYEKGASVVRMLERYLGAAKFRRGVRNYIRRHSGGNTVAADLWQALSEVSGERVKLIARAWIEQSGHPVLALELTERDGRHQLGLRQSRFRERAGRKPSGEKWPIPFVGRVGRGPKGRGRLVRKLVTRIRDSIDLGPTRPLFVYGNAEEAGFFRPDHAPADLAALIAHQEALPALERMGLVDHQWALVRAGRASVGGFLDLAEVLGGETDPDVLAALRKPLAFLAHSLIPDAAPDAADGFRAWVSGCFGPHFAGLGWDPARREPDETRVRRAVLLALVGGIAEDPAVIEVVARRCDRYFENRASLDPNLADGVVSLAARTGGDALYARFLRAMESAENPQEKRRFMLATADFRKLKLVDKTLALSVGDRVPTQDVVFLLGRLLANPAARDRTWAFIQRRWSRLRRRMPSLFASRLIDATPNLMTRTARREVSDFFRKNPVPSGDRALRQALERFDWYAKFRTGAARDLETWLRR